MRRLQLRLLLAAAVALVALVGFAPHGLAQEGGGDEDGTGDLTHASEECIHLLEEGGVPEDCQEAPNPILPERNEIIWGAIGFAAVFLFVWRFGLPAIKKGMNARTERIRHDLDQAEAQRQEAESVLSEYRTQLAEAKGEAGRIIEEARQTADAMRRDLSASAEADIAELRRRAAADIESAKLQAIADLRGEVANLAIGAAERVVERNLDRDTSTQLVESFIAQVGSGR